MKKLSRAFTLLELIIVIIIIGVLSSLALPRMMKMIERTYAAEALTHMASIRSAMERYYLMHNGSYTGAVAFQCTGWQVLGMDPPCGNSHHFFYGIISYAGQPGSLGIGAWRKDVDCSPVCDPYSPVINMKIYPDYKLTGYGAFNNL